MLCSAKGWIRAVKGHNWLGRRSRNTRKATRPRFAVAAETTDRLIVFGTNGRFYTIGVDRLPGGRGHGEPLRLMIDLPNEHDIVALFPTSARAWSSSSRRATAAALSSTARRRWRRPGPASRC